MSTENFQGFTPFELDILLHYHVSPDRHPACRECAPIWPSARDRLIHLGLLYPLGDVSEGRFSTTERADVWIEAALSLPLPEQKWIMPTGAL